MLLRCCIASSFYIKPQRLTTGVPASSVVLHPLSTSNHNGDVASFRRKKLYCILFLHQTTTRGIREEERRPLYCILFLHQTTTCGMYVQTYRCCIASSFYIKPQPRTPDTLIFRHLTASRHDTKRGGVHRGSRFDAVFTFSTNIRKIIFTEIRRCMSVQRAGARLRSDSSEANI